MGSTEIDSSELQIFSNRLKELRSYKKITHKEFAEKIGITAAALSSYENNGKNPSIAVVKRISEEFDVSIDWLCGFSDKMYLNSKATTLADVALKIVDLLEGGLQYDFRLKKHTHSIDQYGDFYLDFPNIPKLHTFFENYFCININNTPPAVHSHTKFCPPNSNFNFLYANLICVFTVFTDTPIFSDTSL